MTRKIRITADSTCDLGKDLTEKLGVDISPLHIVYGTESYDDCVDIFPADIIKRYSEKKELPKTAAVSVGEYIEMFKKHVDEGYDIVHISLGSSISSSHQNAVAAAADMDNVFVVDSQNLSTGSGLLVMKAVDMVNNTELSAKEIADTITEAASKVHMSFVLDDLEFLRAGGRCSMLAALGANLLSIKPCIEVDSSKGSAMSVGRKYRGKLEKVVPQYTREKLSQYTTFDPARAIIVSRDVSEEITANVHEIVSSLGIFKEILTAEAHCTITSHCGAGTIGVCFMTK